MGWVLPSNRMSGGILGCGEMLGRAVHGIELSSVVLLATQILLKVLLLLMQYGADTPAVRL